MRNILLTLAGLVCLASMAKAQDAGPYADLAQYEFGKSRAAVANVEEEIRKATPAQYKAIEARLIATLKQPQATVDGKRYACRLLSIVGSAQCVPAVAPLLADEKLSHPARMALEVLACPEAGAALREAMGKLDGKLLVGVIASVGARRDAAAVPQLAKLLDHRDDAVVNGALCALGEVGTPAAADALKAAKVAQSLERQRIRALIATAAHMAKAGNAQAAVAIYKPLVSHETDFFRAAAVRGMIGSLPRAEAVQFISQVLAGSDTVAREAIAAMLLPSSGGLAERNAVAEQVAGFPPAAQVIVLGVLGEQADVALRPALAKLLTSNDPAVKAAALEAMVVHGTGADVPAMAKQAATDPAVRKVLERMRRPDVDAAVVALLESNDDATRGVAMGLVGARRIVSAVPALVKMLGSATGGEAAKSIGQLGTSEHLPALGAALVSAADDASRSAAEEAMKAICSRATDKAACSKAVIATLGSAKAAAPRSALIRVLPRVGDEAALKVVVAATKDADAQVAEAATRELISWPSFDAVAPLLAMAKDPAAGKFAVLALRDGVLRLASASADRPLPERVATYKSVLEVATRAEEKRQALAGLSELNSAEALALLQKQMSEPALAQPAAEAAVKLARKLGAIYPQQAMKALEEIKASAAAPAAARTAAEEAIAALKDTGQSDGYIVAWLMAAPFTQADKDGAALFDIAFPPEKNDAKVAWQPVAATPQSRVVELNKILGGDERVGYLKAQLTSKTAQDILLEVGSDDGVKIWLNGKQIHANNTVRPCTPGSDRVKAQLKEGANVLLVKVTQGGGEWAAIVRIRSASGGTASGVTVGLPE